MSEDPLSRQGSGSAFAQTDVPSTGDQPSRPHRRRRRRRRRGGGRGGRRGGRPGFPGGASERLDELSLAGPEKPVEGVLYLPSRENAPGVLVAASRNYLPLPSDPLVPRELINKESLEAGAMIAGQAVEGGRI